MANKHYNINEEVEVTLTLKVKIKECSNYTTLDESQISDNVKDFKSEIKEHLRSKISNEYYSEEVTFGVDNWSYEVQ